MHKSKITPPLNSKLSQTLAKFAQNTEEEKAGFITNTSDKTIYFKTKSFRLRQNDFFNLINIVNNINKESSRKVFSDSEVIRGIINYISEDLEHHIKKLSKHVSNSS